VKVHIHNERPVCLLPTVLHNAYKIYVTSHLWGRPT